MIIPPPARRIGLRGGCIFLRIEFSADCEFA
jgi:hypothetical protein